MQSYRDNPEQKGLVAWFTRNPVAANLLMFIIIAAGAYMATQLKVEGWPGLAPKSVNVSVIYPSGSAKSTLEGVTIKVEEALDSVRGIKKIRSVSDASGTRLTIDRKSGYDLDTLYRDVKNKVDTISTLPADAEKPIVTQEEGISGAVNVSIYGDVSQDVLQETARRLRDQLLANPDINLVKTKGNQVPEITVQVDESKLQALNISLSDIATKLNEASKREGKGLLFSEHGTLTIKADQPRYWLREFESVIVKETLSGQRITLADIAVVKDGYEQSGIISRFNGQPSVMLDVQRYNNTGDVIAITEQVKNELNKFRTSLPAEIQVEAWNDQSLVIKDRLGLMLKNGLMGAALVMLVLSLFLSIRLAFWVAAGLPVIISGALLLLGPGFFNISLNDLTTFGLILVLGIVVDDAVVVGESIYTEQNKDRHLNNEDTHLKNNKDTHFSNGDTHLNHHARSLAATIRGAQKVTIATVFGVLTTVAAFSSLFLVKGDLGQVFAYFVYAAVFCLVFAMIESKLILPAHLAHSSFADRGNGSKNFIQAGWYRIQSFVSGGLIYLIEKLYRPFLGKVLGLRYATVMVMISLFILVVGLVMSGKIRTVFFPDIPDESIQIQLDLEQQAGYQLVQSQAIYIEQVGAELGKALAEENNLSSSPITQIMTITGDNSATILAGLTPAANRSDNPQLSTNAIVNRWRASIGSLEAVSQLKFVTSWQGVPDLEIELRSVNEETLKASGAEVVKALGQYQGVYAIQNSLKTGQAQVDLKLRPEGRAMGLTVGMLAQQVKYAYQGYEVQRIQRGKDEVKVKVRYPDSQRQSLENLNRARIRTAEGRVVSLAQVADISTRYVSKQVEQIDRQQVAVITADIDKKQVTAAQILETLDSELLKQLQVNYPDLTIKIEGEAQEQAESTQSLMVAFAIALFSIFALLAIPLKSYTQPLLIMVSIPFGVIGALLGHYIHSTELSLLSLFGIVALSGVVVNNSLLLVTRFNELKQTGISVQQAIIDAACSRMRAVVITSLTTYLGLVPLILETSTSALSLIPAALAMGYGVLFGSTITLILVPALVMIENDLSFRKRAKKGSATDTLVTE